MKVFISWSGERSKALAQAIHDWIPLVLHYVQPWLSEADIEAGERWAEAVAKELESSNFGVICINRENVGSPWVLFEAGALAKSMQGSKVIPLLLDLDFRDITGPLAQFQAKKVDRSGLNEVVDSINKAAAQPVPDGQARKLFDALWPEFEKQLDAIPKQATPAKHTRPQHEILEDLVASVRALDSRMREGPGEPTRPFRQRRPRHYPMMLMEMADMTGEGPGGPVRLLIMASLFREEMPWLYEIGVEAYRAARTSPPPVANRALRRFRQAVELSVHGPVPSEEFGLDRQLLHMVEAELEHGLMRESSPEENQEKPKRKREEKPQ